MTESKGDDVAWETDDLLDERVERLREIVPEAFREGKIDCQMLKKALGEAVDDSKERYSFTWAGKQEAMRLLQVPSRATLVPCPEESVEFEETGNLFIEGDNLEVMKLLYRAYAGRVKMIYIDPPYNTGNDFIYEDDYSDPLGSYLEMTEQVDEEGNLLTSNSETSGRYHSAWLSMMYPRLFLARQLLRENGAIFVSIDDNELQNLRLCMNEVFGEENFIATVIWQKVYAPKNTAKHFSVDHDYIVVYARNAQEWRPELLPRSEEAKARYSNPDDDPRGPWKASDLTARNYYSKGQYEVTGPGGKTFSPTVGNYWRVSEDKFHDLDEDNRIWWGPDGSSMPALKRFLSEVKEGVVPQTLWSYEEVGHTQEAKKELISRVDFQETENVLNSVKPPRLLRRILQVATEPDGDDIALDFFAGSAPLAQAVMEQNREDGGHRRFVCVQFPEPLPRPEEKLTTIADLGKARVRSLIDEFRSEESDLDFEAQDEEREDLGFRVFRLCESHFRRWKGVAERNEKRLLDAMEDFADPLMEGWKSDVLDVVWEVAMKEGYSLSARVEYLGNLPTKNEMGPIKPGEPYPRVETPFTFLFRVTDVERGQSFLICLDDEIQEGTSHRLELGKNDMFVCRDVALTDEQAANLSLQCRLKTI